MRVTGFKVNTQKTTVFPEYMIVANWKTLTF